MKQKNLMVKRYSLLMAWLSISCVSIAQSNMQEPGNGIEDFTFNNNQKSLDSCGFNVNGYLTTKLSVAEYYYLNTGDLAEGTDGYPERAQYYTANTPITVSGVSFYAFIYSTNNDVTTTQVVTNLYSANADSSINSLLASDTITVTGNSFNSFLPDMQFTSVFDAPITVNSGYLVSVETMGNDSLALISNSFVNDDGGMEHLGYSRYSWPFDTQYDGWYDHTDFGPGWDADFLILPVIKTQVSAANAFVLSTEDTICLGETTQIDYTQSDIFSNEMYSVNAANPLNEINYDFVEAQYTASSSANHMLSTAGLHQIIARDTFKLWAPGGATSCLVTDTFEVLVKDTVLNGDYTFDIASGGYSVNFYPATSSDSIWLVKWVFDDEGEESTELSPTHIFSDAGTFNVQMIISNGCTTDTVTKMIGITSVNEFELENVSIYPNPSKDGLVNISGMENKLNSISIRNAMGQVVYKNSNLYNQIKIDLSNIVYGVYFVTLESEDRKTLTRKLIISK